MVEAEFSKMMRPRMTDKQGTVMPLSVEDNLLRCFSKFGEKAASQAARTQMKWHNTSFYKPAAGGGDKKDSSRSPATDCGRSAGPSRRTP
jgi:hypothetical protein